MSNMFSALGDIFQQIADHTGDVRQRQQKMAKVEQAQKRIFTLMDLNRYEEAIKCIEDLMVEIPEVASSGRAWAFRAFFLVQCSQPEKASQSLDKAFQLDPSLRNDKMLVDLSIHAKSGNGPLK